MSMTLPCSRAAFPTIRLSILPGTNPLSEKLSKYGCPNAMDFIMKGKWRRLKIKF